jgi:hypothetical protein
MDAQASSFPDNKLTHSFTNFAIMAIYARARQSSCAHLPDFEAWRNGRYHDMEAHWLCTWWSFHKVQKVVKPKAPVSKSHPSISSEWFTDSKLRNVFGWSWISTSY